MGNPDRTVSDVKTQPEHQRLANMLTLEIVFLSVIGLIVVAAFIEALSYKLVSSRTPFVIMVPLIVLIVIHARRLFRVRDRADFPARLKAALSGRIPALNKVVSISVWMGVMLALITALGHYIGILLFSFILMRILARERLMLALTISVVSTVLIALLFEYGFNVEMYRGLLFRWFAGYRDFG